MKADVEDAVALARARQEQRAATAERTDLARGRFLVLGDRGVPAHRRNAGAGARDSQRLDGKTVLIGDHLIVSRIGYDAGIPFTPWHVPLWRNPKRQQIIVFRAPLPEEGYPDFIKRCIGVPATTSRSSPGRST